MTFLQNYKTVLSRVLERVRNRAGKDKEEIIQYQIKNNTIPNIVLQQPVQTIVLHSMLTFIMLIIISNEIKIQEFKQIISNIKVR